ncbi:hypothetical protein VYU27_000273 [Nannochloropsis oceanica]
MLTMKRQLRHTERQPQDAEKNQPPRVAGINTVVCAIDSPLWQRVRVVTLEENVRIRAAHDAGQDLRIFSNGMRADLLLALEFVLPPFMHPPSELNYDPIRLLDHVYGDFNNARNTTKKTLIDRTILNPKNKDVDASNDYAVHSFPGEEMVYLSADRPAQDDNEDARPMDYTIFFILM